MSTLSRPESCADIVEGAVRSTIDELVEATGMADKVIVF